MRRASRWQKRGYLTKAGVAHFNKILIKKLQSQGFIKDGKMSLRFGSNSVKKGDLVMTFEIHRVVGDYSSGSIGAGKHYSVTSVLPICSCRSCNPDLCGHECIKTLGPGQQGITKILKVR